MSDLFKKLNVLVKSSINDMLGDVTDATRRRNLDPRKLGKDLEKEVAYLRERVNDAVAHEETLQARIDALYQEVNTLDLQADEAVQRGDDAEARHLVTRMKRTQQRLMMAESDLQEHRTVTQDLLQRVNMLDAVVSEAKHKQEPEQSEQPQVPAETSIDQARQSLSNMLKSARESIATAREDVQETIQPMQSEETDTPTDDPAVEDDLAARLQRLSKPKK